MYGILISTQSKADFEEFPFPRSCSSPSLLQSQGWDWLRYPQGSISQSTPGVIQGWDHIPRESRTGNVETAPSPRCQNPPPPRSPRAGGAPEAIESNSGMSRVCPVVKVQIHGFPIGTTSPSPDGAKRGSDIPRVPPRPRGESPGTAHSPRQPQRRGRSAPPAPSPASSSSAGKRGVWGQRDPQERPGPPPDPDPVVITHPLNRGRGGAPRIFLASCETAQRKE